MNITHFQFNHFGQNTYLIADPITKKAAVIDPGCFFDPEKKELLDFIHNNELSLDAILYTHCHLDHVFGAAFVKREFPSINVYGHKEEMFFINDAIGQGLRYGISIEQPPKISSYVTEGSVVTIGELTLLAIHVPGHSAGSICYYHAGSHSLFAGDVLFSGSIGRSDLPGGNHDVLINGISKKLLVLPENTSVYCGHGPQTTIGTEKKTNPFLQ